MMQRFDLFKDNNSDNEFEDNYLNYEFPQKIIEYDNKLDEMIKRINNIEVIINTTAINEGKKEEKKTSSRKEN